jgi:EAL domain-containing protein (putative c-di-GMP-specific phosphodiesterase class I)
MRHPDRVVPSLRALRRLGVRIALDDFGSGYSSLTHLRSLPLDIIKIDRSFVRGIVERPEDRAIVTAILSLARETEMSVICEGVETETLHAVLVGLGCELAQGFFYDRPKPAAELVLGGYTSRVGTGVGDPLVIREFMRQIGIPARIAT